MTNWDWRNRLHKLQFSAHVNLLYHQDRQDYYDKLDKKIRVWLGAITIIGVVFAVPDVFWTWVAWLGLLIAMLSAMATIALSIVIVGDTAKIHGELFRLWSDLHADAVIAEQKACDLGVHGIAPEDACERLLDMVGKAERLCADEPKMDKALYQFYEREVRVAKGLETDSCAVIRPVSTAAAEVEAATTAAPNLQ